jgi:hypothetical protein
MTLFLVLVIRTAPIDRSAEGKFPIIDMYGFDSKAE